MLLLPPAAVAGDDDDDTAEAVMISRRVTGKALVGLLLPSAKSVAVLDEEEKTDARRRVENEGRKKRCLAAVAVMVAVGALQGHLLVQIRYALINMEIADKEKSCVGATSQCSLDHHLPRR